jgi:chromosome partitioning protein
MAVISFANAKGGAGKTTAALILAMDLAQRGQRVVILDADPQHWITSWAEISGPVRNISVISTVSTASIQGHIRENSGSTDHFIIDLAGACDALVALAIGLSDHVFIPVQGCSMDARGAAIILELIQRLDKAAGVRISHSVVLTRVSSVVTTKAMQAIKSLLATRGVPVLDTPINERSAYRDMFDCGGSLYTMDPHRVSNLDKAQENARMFAQNVEAVLPARINTVSRFMKRAA